MAGSKKPRKKYQRGKVLAGGNLPAPIDKVRQTELKVLAAITALKTGQYNTDIAMDLIVFLTVCQSVMAKTDSDALRMMLAAFRAINDIKDREIRTGKWGVSGDELRVLTEVLPVMLDLYKQMNRDEIAAGHAIALEKLVRAKVRVMMKNT